MSDIKTVKQIAQKPWEYTLYEVNNSYWVMSIPYSPKSYVDTSMSIKLSDEETRMAKEDQTWLSTFAEKVRYSPDKYLGRALSADITGEK